MAQGYHKKTLANRNGFLALSNGQHSRDNGILVILLTLTQRSQFVIVSLFTIPQSTRTALLKSCGHKVP